MNAAPACQQLNTILVDTGCLTGTPAYTINIHSFSQLLCAVTADCTMYCTIITHLGYSEGSSQTHKPINRKERSNRHIRTTSSVSFPLSCTSLGTILLSVLCLWNLLPISIVRVCSPVGSSPFQRPVDMANGPFPEKWAKNTLKYTHSL